MKTEDGAVGGEAMRGRFAPVYSQEYASQFLAHATMEPMNCTAHVTDEECKVWGPIQGNQLRRWRWPPRSNCPRRKSQSTARCSAADSGAGFLVDFILQAALVSRAVRKPVKVVWSREEDMRHDAYRPATLQRVTAGLDRSGKPAAMAHESSRPRSCNTSSRLQSLKTTIRAASKG